MRYMILIKNDPKSEDGMPSPAALEAMSNYNKSLLDAGVLLAVEGLSGSSHGARISVTKGTTIVTDGPFTEAKR
jgi:hypothetical protein